MSAPASSDRDAVPRTVFTRPSILALHARLDRLDHLALNVLGVDASARPDPPCEPNFRDYVAQIVANAQALAAALAGQGFRLVSGGTDNHLMLVDLRTFDAELTGKVAQEVLDRAGITLNKNTVPNDPRSPFVTSGLRIGTPAVTTAGMKEPEMAAIAALIGRTLRHRDDDAEVAAVRDDVAVLCSKFTPYPGR